MDAARFIWDDVAEDNPIALLTRRVVKGEKMLVARVSLAKGCHVKEHHHESEQIAIMVSGLARWWLGASGGENRRELLLHGGEVLVLPANVPHEVIALEDSMIFDVLSPIGPMGVDAQALER